MRKLSSQTAAKRAGVTSATIMNWCKYPRFTVGNKSIGEISLGEWRVNPRRLDLIIEGNRTELIKELFKEKLKDFLRLRHTVWVYFEIRDSTFYLNMFRDEIQYYGRRRNLDLSVEVPFLSHLNINKLNLSPEIHLLDYLNTQKKEPIPIPLPRIKLIEILDEMGFKKMQNIHILRYDGKKRK